MKKNKILAPMMVVGTLALTTGCGMGSTYEPEYSYDVEVDTYLEWLEDSVDYFEPIYGLMGLDLPNVKASKFEEIKTDTYVYERSGTELIIYTKGDEISRIEAKMDNKEADDEDILSMATLFEVACMTLNPEFYFDTEGSLEFKEFFKEVGEEIEDMESNEDYSETFTLHDSDYEVEIKDGHQLVMRVTANGEDEFEHKTMEQAVEILEKESYAYFLDMVNFMMETGTMDSEILYAE